MAGRLTAMVDVLIPKATELDGPASFKVRVSHTKAPTDSNPQMETLAREFVISFDGEAEERIEAIHFPIYFAPFAIEVERVA